MNIDVTPAPVTSGHVTSHVTEPDPEIEGFQAPWWLPGGHLQTVWRKLVGKPVLTRNRQRIELADGDFIDVDFLPAQQAATVDAASETDKPLVFLLHGLAGSSDSPYILAMQSLLYTEGYDSVAMNLRGCSGDFNRLAVAYHSGCSYDVEEVITSIASGRKLVVIGYSLGANVLVKWLSETVHSHQLMAAVSVSNPFSLALCCERMKTGVAAWYGSYFLTRLRKDLAAKQLYFEQSGCDDQLALIKQLGSLRKLKTLWDFDDAVTAPLHGFKGALDYYDRCSSLQFLPSVHVPTLIVHGRNDPIIPLTALPSAASLAANVRLEVLAAGGHVGFAANRQPQWLERRILRFIELTGTNQSCSVSSI